MGDEMDSPGATEAASIADRVRAQEDAARMEDGGVSGREILAAAQDSSLVGESMFSLGVRPYLLEPHWPRNGREAGAWVAGVMDALSDPSGSIHVRLKPEHEEGAAGALLSAGFKVERYASDLYGVVPLDVPDGWTGQSVTLLVSR